MGLVELLVQQLFSPEETVVGQGHENSQMYYIMSGDCIANVKEDRTNKEHIAHTLLSEGDHFGEISILYDCLT